MNSEISFVYLFLHPILGHYLGSISRGRGPGGPGQRHLGRAAVRDCRALVGAIISIFQLSIFLFYLGFRIVFSIQWINLAKDLFIVMMHVGPGQFA